jgi:hypothetical protein
VLWADRTKGEPMSRDWLTLWIECASDETLDEFVARTEAEQRQAEARDTPFYRAMMAGMQNAATGQPNAYVDAFRNAYSTQRQQTGPGNLSGLLGGIGGALGNAAKPRG